MGKLWNFIKESYQAGYQEAKEEEEQATQGKLNHSSEVIVQLSEGEIFGSCLAAPFRTSLRNEWFSVFKSEKMSKSEIIVPLELYTFGETLSLTEDEKMKIKKQQELSFDIRNKEEVLKIAKTFLLSAGVNVASLADYETLESWNMIIHGKKLEAVLLSAAAVNLISAVDLNMLSKEKAINIFDELRPYVVESYQSWDDFGERFLAQEAVLKWNKGIARKSLEQDVDYLTYKSGSPWVRFPLQNFI